MAKIQPAQSIHAAVSQERQTNRLHKFDILAELKKLVDRLEVLGCDGDGAYDKWKVYDTLLERDNIVPIIPPRRDAKIKQHGNRKLPPLARDVAIRGIRKLGRSEWKRQVGYHRRSLAETAMYRMKTIFGASLKNRSRSRFFADWLYRTRRRIAMKETKYRFS
jgi:hypothetical protein